MPLEDVLLRPPGASAAAVSGGREQQDEPGATGVGVECPCHVVDVLESPENALALRAAAAPAAPTGEEERDREEERPSHAAQSRRARPRRTPAAVR